MTGRVIGTGGGTGVDFGRTGVTLIELTVALAVVAILSALTGLAWRPPPERATRARGPSAQVDSARGVALQSRRPVRVHVPLSGDFLAVTAMPDGRVLGAEALGYDPLTGKRTAQP